MTNRRLPAEWEKQSGVMLTWPRPEGDWNANFESAENAFLNIAGAISQYELVLIVCSDDQQQNDIREKLENTNAVHENFRFACLPSNDTWARDHGPITVIQNGTPLLLDFVFNGWGNKYPSDLDNKISRQLHSENIFGSTAMEPINFVLEGGSVDSDGMGTLLTTRNCLLNPSRNKNLDEQGIESFLKKYLGIESVLWLNHGELSGDDTDSHIDTLARFTDKNTIAYVACNDQDDEHYDSLMAMQEELQQFRDRDGQAYKLVGLPLPSPKFNRQGDRLPATYANFLVINNAVLVPTYNDENDTLVLNALGECFPGRKIIGINCTALIEQFGSLHCVTMQFP
ncbi:agmatine deiminase family protein, partial [Kaarinaea lacus]